MKRRNNSEVYEIPLFTKGKTLFIASDGRGKIHYICSSLRKILDMVIKTEDENFLRTVIIVGAYPLIKNPLAEGMYDERMVN